jgi:hypothetical protein
MNNSDKNTAVLPLSIPRKTRQGFLLLALLAVLGAGALFHGIVAPLASVAPRSAPLSDVTTPLPHQSVPPHAANANAELGPGVVEPLLVASP